MFPPLLAALLALTAGAPPEVAAPAPRALPAAVEPAAAAVHPVAPAVPGEAVSPGQPGEVAPLDPDAWRWEPSLPPEEEPLSPSTAPPDPTLPSPVPRPVTPPPPPETWVDEGRAYVSERLVMAIERLDRFFGDNRQVDLPRNASWVRWRNDLRVDDRGVLAFNTSLRAEIKVPRVDERLERLSLTLTGGTTSALDQLLPGDPATPDTANQASAGLKLNVFDTLLTHSDFSAGLLFSIPVGWYARLRLRHNQPVSDLFVARMAASGFWQTPTGWGTREDLDLERQLAPKLLLRLSNTATLTEVSRGWEWTSELALLTVIGDRTALFLGGGASGATALGPSVEIWRVHARARRDVWRRWLFLEVEPGIEWTRPVGGGRLRDRFVIFRLEVQFDGGVEHRHAGSGT